MTPPDIAFLKQLNINSTPYREPLTSLDWSKLDTSDFWLPPSAISLFGTPEFEQMPEQVKKRLSQYEFIGFIQAGLWLESIFLERLGKQLKHSYELAEHARYLHEIREEAGHSLMFLNLMQVSGLHLPGSWPQKPRFSDFIGRNTPSDSLIFWLALVLGEEIPDRLNRHVRAAKETAINPLIRQMCTLHAIDEARHIAHARKVLEMRLKQSGRMKKQLLAPLVNLLLKQFVTTFYLPRPVVYELAGLTPGFKWREVARHNPVRQEFIRRSINPTLHLFQEFGFRLTYPFQGVKGK